MRVTAPAMCHFMKRHRERGRIESRLRIVSRRAIGSNRVADQLFQANRAGKPIVRCIDCSSPRRNDNSISSPVRVPLSQNDRTNIPHSRSTIDFILIHDCTICNRDEGGDSIRQNPSDPRFYLSRRGNVMWRVGLIDCSRSRGRSPRTSRRKSTRQTADSAVAKSTRVTRLAAVARPAGRQSALAFVDLSDLAFAARFSTRRKRRVGLRPNDTHHPSHQTRTSLRDPPSVMMTVTERRARASR